MNAGAAAVICIDGPSGVGKGTVARSLALRLGWRFLDSGALYRILALAAVDGGVSPEDPHGLASLAKALEIDFEVEQGQERIRVAGADRTGEVRDEETGNAASMIAAHAEVRAALLTRQRGFRRPPGLVADGRDMGTVVFPDSGLKVFLEASAEERARRRLGQLREAGKNAKLSILCAEIRERDRRDRNRLHSPLKPAEDAEVIDTTRLSVDAVLAEVFALVRVRGYAT